MGFASTQRHHSVLSVIAELAQEHLPENHQLTTHLGDSYEFSTNIIASTLRPDMVQEERRKTKYLVELIVCYWFQKRQQGERYKELTEETRRKHYESNIITIQVGGRGERIFAAAPTRWRNFLTLLTLVTMQQSHTILCSKKKLTCAAISWIAYIVKQAFYH